VGDTEVNLAGARRAITVKQGIEQALAKKLVAELRAAKLKVDAQIQGDKLRVNGKKRDDLQLAMALLRKAATELPLQFENFAINEMPRRPGKLRARMETRACSTPNYPDAGAHVAARWPESCADGPADGS